MAKELAEIGSRLDVLERKGPASTVIRLTSLEGTDDRCEATIDDTRMQQNVNRLVFWDIRDDCGQTGNWRVELDFGESSPFPDTVLAGRVVIRERATSEGEYIYKVWMQPAGGGERYMMIDPELYIEQ